MKQQHQDTDLSMLDYYHSDTAGRGMASSRPPSVAAAADMHHEYETASSSDDALSMGPNGYYHPQRTSSRSSSPGYSDAHSRRYSSTTVRHGDHARYRSETKTPTGSAFRTDSPSGMSSGRDSPTITMQRQPSKHAAANADNRRIAIMEIGSAPMNSFLSNEFSEPISDSKLAHMSKIGQAPRAYSRSEGHHDSNLSSSRRGMSEMSC
jgi:hypothetical protein